MPTATMTTPTEIPWLDRLGSTGAEREEAIAELRALLLRAARFQLGRRPAGLELGPGEAEDLAQQSADDALLAVLAKLDQFRGESRFTTWAYKFALLEAAVKARRREWRGRELPLEHDALDRLAASPAGSAQRQVEDGELFAALREEIETALSERQRRVLVAVALDDVPIDVLAERLDSTRGALYKTLHDARRKLRSALAARGFEIATHGEEGP